MIATCRQATRGLTSGRAYAVPGPQHRPSGLHVLILDDPDNPVPTFRDARHFRVTGRLTGDTWAAYDFHSLTAVPAEFDDEHFHD